MNDNKLIKKVLFLILMYGIPSFALLFGLFTLSILRSQNNDLQYLINEVNMESKIEKVNALLSNTNTDITPLDILLKNGENINSIETEFNNTYDLLNSDNTDKQSELDDLNKKKNEIKTKNDELLVQYNALSSHLIKNVITINQYPKYPNGCELVALDILLKYYNVNASVDDIIKVLPMGKTPYYSNGKLYGGNPNYEFLGDPRLTSGWGIWDKGLAKVAENFKPNVINGTGMDFDEILKLVYNDRPVVVWTSINLINPYIANKWIYKETGEQIVWKRFNHAVVVIGYNKDNIIISDPINGKIRYMNRTKFINVYNFMGKRAIYY